LDEKYDGGKALVNNPDPHGRKKQVSVNYALKTESYRHRLSEEYHKWYGENKEKAKTRGRPKKVNPESVTPKPVVVPTVVEPTVVEVPKYGPHKALMGEYTVEGMLEQYREHIEAMDLEIPSMEGNELMNAALTKSMNKLTAYDENVVFYKGQLELWKKEEGVTSPFYKSCEKNLRNATVCKQRMDAVKELMTSEGFKQIEMAGLSQYVNPNVTTYKTSAIYGDWIGSSTMIGSYKIHNYLKSKGVKGTHPNGIYPTEVSESLKKAFEQDYAYQQAVFKHWGITHITLYRGVSDPKLETEPPMHGDKVQIKTREASSWSANPEVATRFGTRMVKCRVPVEQIFASPIVYPSLDGGSSLSESEYVVMGSEDLDCEVFLNSTLHMWDID
jgi:hypothetical protein